MRHIGPGLHVIYIGRFVPEPLVGREWGTGSWHSPAAFYWCHKGGLFSADKGSSAFLDVEVKGEPASHDIFTHESVFFSLFYCVLESLYCEGIFSAAVYITFACTHCICTYKHSFKDSMGVSFKYRTVHESTRVSLVRIADDIFEVALCSCAEAPLEACGESAASAAAEARGLYFLYDVLRFHLRQDLCKSCISIPCDIFLDIIGIYITAV